VRVGQKPGDEPIYKGEFRSFKAAMRACRQMQALAFDTMPEPDRLLESPVIR
jgi:hypothetical protein